MVYEMEVNSVRFCIGSWPEGPSTSINMLGGDSGGSDGGGNDGG